jgi:PAS domain S-box-containing protein
MQISFYSRVGYSFLIIILIPLVLMGFGMFVVVSSTMNDTILEKNQDLVNSVSYKLQLILQNTEDSLRNTSRLIEMGQLDYDDLQIYLEKIEAETSMIDMIQIVDSDGRVGQVIPFDASLLGIDLSGHRFLREAGKSRGFFWSQSFLSPESGEPTVTVSAVFDDFSIVYYLNLRFLGLSLFSERDKEHGILFILDKDGTFIAHPDELLVARRENMRHDPVIRRVIDLKLSTQESEITNDEILTLKMIEPTEWILVYVQSASDAFSQILFYRKIMILGSLLTFLLAALILFLLIRDTINPLRSLIDTTRQISSGSYQRYISHSRVREINELAEHFNSMVLSVKEREEELIKLRNYLSSIIDSMPSVLICLDKNLDVVLWNRMAKDVTGFDYTDAIGNPLEKVYPQLSGSKDIIRDCLDWKKASIRKAFPREEAGRDTVFEDITIYPLLTGELEGAVINVDDVSQRVKMEKVVLQTEKLSSLGGLAAGMAHDLNNLLTPILGYSEILNYQYGDNPEISAYSQQIQDAGVRSQNLVRQLLAFSRKQTLEYKPINLNETVLGFEKLLRRTIREDISIDLEPGGGEGMILADIGQIEQVLMNLCVNAQDAMPEGGVLTIRTGNTSLDEETASRLEVEPGDYDELVVSDTGSGIDEATLTHIFEPFYSTKGDYGTGLGLATVYGIIKQHKGCIQVFSESGRGSRFHICLKSAGSRQTPNKDRKALEKSTGGSESILIAEDNEQVRALAEAVLEQAGYAVTTAENGEAALRILQDPKSEIDLLLTDVIMPVMNGNELFIKARELNSKIKVIYMSGYTDNIISLKGELEKGVFFIQKPFTLTSLTKTVREALDVEIS